MSIGMPDGKGFAPSEVPWATVVGDTIHTGATVANIKRRKSKHKATEPAGDGG